MLHQGKDTVQSHIVFEGKLAIVLVIVIAEVASGLTAEEQSAVCRQVVLNFDIVQTVIYIVLSIWLQEKVIVFTRKHLGVADFFAPNVAKVRDSSDQRTE